MKLIKRILTAIGNSYLNNELKKTNEFAVIGSDILYKEGIIETLEIDKNIDYIIFNESLPGEIDLEELIDNIRNINDVIKIYAFLETENEEKIKLLNSLNIDKIFFNDEKRNNYINIIKYIENFEKYNYEINKEIDEIKKQQNNYLINNKYIRTNNKEKNNNKIIINKICKLKYIIVLFIETKVKEKIDKFLVKNSIINKIKNVIIIKNNKFIINKLKNNKLIKKINFIKNINISKKLLMVINNEKENNSNTNGKVISVLGNSGAGKSCFSIILANLLKEKNKKILILDFDFLNNSLHTMLGVKKYPDKIKNILLNKNEKNIEKIEINNLKIKINKKLDLISGINLIFESGKNIEKKKIKIIINKLINMYDYIIIDTSSECFFEYTKEIMDLSFKCFFITEANLSEISKSKRLLEIYHNNWNISNEKIKIIFNKYNRNCIDLNLLKKIYFEYEIVGKINMKKNNNYFKKVLGSYNIKICKKILKKQQLKIME